MASSRRVSRTCEPDHPLLLSALLSQDSTYSGLRVPNCHSPFSRPGWGARGGGGCAGCLWARERYAMSALRCFITSKAKLKRKRGRESCTNGCFFACIMSPQRARYNLDLPLLHSCAQQLVDPRRDLGERANHVARRKAPARGVPADVMIVRQGSGVAQASGPNPMSFPSVNSC